MYIDDRNTIYPTIYILSISTILYSPLWNVKYVRVYDQDIYLVRMERLLFYNFTLYSMPNHC